MTNDKPIKKKPTMVLVSACLLGVACRYDGESKPNARILSYNRDYSFIPFCPETYGGLTTPRPAAEIQPDGRVLNSEGEDVSAAYQAGAERAVTLCRDFHIDYAILKSRSPACGPESSYDGSFTHTLIKRPGCMAKALMDAGVTVFSDENFTGTLSAAQPDEAPVCYATIEEGACVGCGSCAALAPEVFRMNDRGTAEALAPVDAAHKSEVQEAMNMCPADCIHWESD